MFYLFLEVPLIISLKDKFKTIRTMNYILSTYWIIIPTCCKIRILIGERLREVCIQFVFINQTIKTVTFI